MQARKIRAVAGGLVVVILVALATLVAERIEARRSFDRQRSLAADEIETLASRLTRDATQEIAIVQGLAALAAANPEVTQPVFVAYTRNFRRAGEALHRVYLVRDGKIILTDRPASGAQSLTRVEERLVAADPMVARAIESGSFVMKGPFKTTEGDDVFLYARPVFLGDGKPGADRFWGFAGTNIEDDAITCRLGLCEENPRYRMALRVVIGEDTQPAFFGDNALFAPASDAVRGIGRIPGVRIEMAAIPAGGWVHDAPHRRMIFAVGAVVALIAGGLVAMIFSGAPGAAVRLRLWAALASVGVLLVGLGLAAVIDRLESERVGAETREAVEQSLEFAAARATRDLSDAAAVIQNLTTFVVAEPNFTDQEFQSYTDRLLQNHSELRSIQLSKDAKVSHVAPAARALYGAVGTDLRRNPADAALIDQSIESGQPLFSGPLRIAPNVEAFVYRRPIYLGDGQPGRGNFWGFVGLYLGRNAVVCKFDVCTPPAKYRYAMRLVANNIEQPPFIGDAAMFAPKSDAQAAAIRLPGGRIEIAAVPIEGWSTGTIRRLAIWLVAVPLSLAASAGLLLVFFGLSVPVLRVWLGVIATVFGVVLALLADDIAEMLRGLGIGQGTIARPAIVTLIAFAVAYAAHAALAAFVWPQRPSLDDGSQRAPAILRSIVLVLLYALAALWAAAFAFNLDLQAVGLTSGAVGIIVGLATQRLILDFFSGVMIGIERPFALGDWIEVSSGGKDVRGVVCEMTWRTTSVRNPALDIVTIPNSALAQATVVNRSRPNRWTQVVTTIAIGVDVPAERVTAIVLEALQPLVGNILTAERKPSVHATAVDDGDVRYAVHVYATLGPNSETPIRTEVLRALQHAFAAHEIEFSQQRAIMQLLTDSKGGVTLAQVDDDSHGLAHDAIKG